MKNKLYKLIKSNIFLLQNAFFQIFCLLFGYILCCLEGEQRGVNDMYTS